jgi:hypothetical protein
VDIVARVPDAAIVKPRRVRKYRSARPLENDAWVVNLRGARQRWRRDEAASDASHLDRGISVAHGLVTIAI